MESIIPVTVASKIAQDGFKLAKMVFKTVKKGEEWFKVGSTKFKIFQDIWKMSGMSGYEDAFEMGHIGYD